MSGTGSDESRRNPNDVTLKIVTEEAVAQLVRAPNS